MGEYSNLDIVIADLSYKTVMIASVLLIILTSVSLFLKKINKPLKVFLFGSIAIITLLTTVFIAGATVYLNSVSVSKGPVHHHADIEFWECGQELQLKDPQGLSNKIGTPTLHEHNDKRIHLEGVVVGKNDASLGKFMQVIDGGISPSSITIPTDSGKKTLISGQNCPDGTTAHLQVFIYRVNQGIAVQEKLTNPQDFIIAPYSAVPPGDCIIVEFDQEKDKTDKICRSFKVAQELGKIKI